MPEAGSRSVLFVDDDQLNRHLMARLFRKHRPDDRLLVAASGDDALAQARANDVDLVLLDLTLPGISGEEVLRILKTEASMPVVILTGHVDPGIERRLTDLGAAAYVAKPFDAKELFALIGRLLSS